MTGGQGFGVVPRRDWVWGAAVALAAVAVGGMWGPWFASGSATRNSFGFFRAAQVLGIEWVTPFRIAWFLLPILLPLAAALLVFGLRRSSGAVLGLLGLVLAGAGVLSVLGLGFFWGAAAAAVAGTSSTVVAVVAAVATTGDQRRLPQSSVAGDLSK